MAGPASGDGASSLVDASNYTFIELFVDVEPDNAAVLRNLNENQTFDVALKVDARKVYGMAFKLTWDAGKLTLNGDPVFSDPWGDKCVILPAPTGVLSYRCNLLYPTPEFDADSSTIMTLSFTANGSALTGNGPWEALFDIAHLPSDTSASAVGGAKVWINNAGYGLPSAPARDITDADDGKLVITGIANYTGFVDLQGNPNDSGAVIQALSQANKATAIVLADATSAAGGGYTTAHLPGRVITIGSTYSLFIDRPLYLPTTITWTDPILIPVPPIPADWEDSHILDVRPLTPLNKAILLGGDAVSDNLIDVLDAGCIGNAYNTDAPNVDDCGVEGQSDVTGDGYTDILDLSLMGGNFTLNQSPWTP